MCKIFNTRKFVFLFFATLIFFKITWFHWLYQHSILISSVLSNPIDFWAFWLPKFAVSIFIASFIFVSKRYWWTFVLALLIDLWCIANMVYFRANGFLLNLEAIGMVDNMSGFWSCVSLFYTWQESVFWITSLLYLPVVIWVNKSNIRNWRSFAITIFLWAAMYFPSNFLNNRYLVKHFSVLCEQTGIKGVHYKYKAIYSPFFDAAYNAQVYVADGTYRDWVKLYIYKHSIVDYAYSCVTYSIQVHLSRQAYQDNIYSIPFTENDYQILQQCYVPNDNLNTIVPSSNLLIILFESLENWVFEDTEWSRQLCPNLKLLIADNHSLFVPCVRSQAIQGSSGDGQMTVLTGLLPLSVGAACRLYGTNTYPNIAQFYPYSYTINSSPGTWNQPVVNPHYGIDSLCEFNSYKSSLDLCETEMALQHIQSNQQPFFLLYISEASHSPFPCENMQPLTLPSDMPKSMHDYLTCIQHTDSCLGILFDELKARDMWDNTTIVVTGDHTVFKETMLNQYKRFAQSQNLSIATGKNYVPLIIHSPAITTNMTVTDICYQMDIYPTMAYLVHCQDYGWKGLGVNLLDDNSVHNRVITEESAYQLSEKIIRNDYFSTMVAK